MNENIFLNFVPLTLGMNFDPNFICQNFGLDTDIQCVAEMPQI